MQSTQSSALARHQATIAYDPCCSYQLGADNHIGIAHVESYCDFNMHDQELQQICEHSVVVKSNCGLKSDGSDRDRTDLIRLGKKPVLKVGLE